ncbi:hypothetical protein T4B_2860 [Trichinella pseudospiralis]|uniref:Uncharacterized protein n=2 Tax=Trichinella pseudospiralis TaxID=6337 RepID=A0A0V1FQD7_TRIPS|nr:hypothetical protein T4D_4804 [Trichinella pseudospiralis]KRZ28915.1 hypothetical protein T4B_2860 [Trichinella pseudospiralis]
MQIVQWNGYVQCIIHKRESWTQLALLAVSDLVWTRLSAMWILHLHFLKADNDRLPASQNGCGVRDTTGRLFGVSDFNIRCRCRLPFYNNSIVDVLIAAESVKRHAERKGRR